MEQDNENKVTIAKALKEEKDRVASAAQCSNSLTLHHSVQRQVASFSEDGKPAAIDIRDYFPSLDSLSYLSTT